VNVTTVTASYSRRFSLEYYGGPKYESIEASASITAELEDGDDPAAALATLNELAKASVKAQAAPVLEHYRKQVATIRDSLPADVKAALED
jgi:hypothetical protein